MIGTRILHYRIDRKLGEGGMGAVYLATDTRLDRQVAIKLLSSDRAKDPESRQRFIHEAKAEAMLSHPNIVTFHEVGEADGQAFIVMEYVEGQPLPDYVQSQKLSVPQILDLVIQAGEGLHAAHEKGVIHRDIKPENIMVTPRGHVKLTDFGLARWKGATTITKTGTRMGTAFYMSPEQAEGRRLDHRSDIFSLGVVLYELLCKQRPFEGVSEAVVLYEILNTQPQPLARFSRDVPNDLERIVNKCLAKNPGERYQHADDLVADLRGVNRVEAVSSITPPPDPDKFVRKRYAYLSAAAIAMIAALFLVLKPFNVEITSDHQAAAAQNRLAVMYFDNLTDTSDSLRLGEIITNLLITDLSASAFLDVVSDQRLYDILKDLGREEAMRIDREVATEVATRAGGRWMILGSILQVEPSLVVTAQLVDVSTGSAVASQRVTGGVGDDVFSLVDSLAAVVKVSLPLPIEARQEFDPPIANVTTHSARAYRHFIEGVRQFERFYTQEARRHFEAAVAEDSTFAMAYAWLARSTRGTRDAAAYLARALEHSDRLPELERYYVHYMAAMEAGDYGRSVDELKTLLEHYPFEKYALCELATRHNNQFHDYEKAVIYARKAIEIDSSYKNAFNLLAYAYSHLGDVERSLWAINKYIELAPNDPNPFHSRAELYAVAGQPDKAIESYLNALEIDPDFYGALWYLGDAYVRKGDYARADSVYRRLASHPEKVHRARGRLCLARIDRHRGRFARALQRLNTGIEADSIELGETNFVTRARKILARTRVYYWSLGDMGATISEANRLLHTAPKYDRYDPWMSKALAYLAFASAQEGDLARSNGYVAEYEMHIDTTTPQGMTARSFVRGHLNYLKGEYEMALTHLQLGNEDLSSMECLGLCYLALGRPGDAVPTLERALNWRVLDEDFSSPERSVRLHYYLGQAYEMSGWHPRAIEQYETFLDIWRNADAGLEFVEDAKVRLARLKTEL